jgi:hypothetical protein
VEKASSRRRHRRTYQRRSLASCRRSGSLSGSSHQPCNLFRRSGSAFGSRSRCPVGVKKHNFGPSWQARHGPTQENVDFFAGRPPLDRALSQAV